jgi:DNA-binding XRE family transcriptional regulator
MVKYEISINKGGLRVKVYAKETLRAARIKQGHTIVSLAKAIGTTKQTIGQVERRVNGIGPDKAKQITIALGVKFDDIFELVD